MGLIWKDLVETLGTVVEGRSLNDQPLVLFIWGREEGSAEVCEKEILVAVTIEGLYHGVNVAKGALVFEDIEVPSHSGYIVAVDTALIKRVLGIIKGEEPE